MRLPRAFRIARHDAAVTMRTWTYAGLVLAPVLLGILLAFLVAIASFMMIVLQMVAPEESPTGHRVAAVVVPEGLDSAQKALVDDLVEQLRAAGKREAASERMLRQFARFALSAGGRLEVENRPGTPALADTTPSQDDAASSPTMFAALRVERLEARDVSTRRTLVPGTYDAALLLDDFGPEQVRYEIVSDPALVYSRAAARRLEAGIEAFNGRRRLRRMSDRGWTIVVADARTEPPDPWLVKLLLYLAMTGLAIVYHSVGMQSVASVLAGEREARTLDVLLSLPLTWRTVLWGKTLGILAATTLPTLAWSAVLTHAARKALGIDLSPAPVLAVIVSGLALLTAAGCVVSATSSSTIVAKNRLGVVNLVLFLLGTTAVAVAVAFRPRVGRMLGTALAAGYRAGDLSLAAIALTLALLAGTAIVVELGARLARKH